MRASKISLEESVQSLLEPILMATLQARWDGVDGVSYYLNSGRIDALGKICGANFKMKALMMIFHKIAKATEQAIEPLVLKKFTEHYPEVVVACAKEDPEIFRASVMVSKYCCASLPVRLQKKFLSLVAVNEDVA